MTGVFDVSPYDGGWCVKITDTGEVLFFTARRHAIAEALRLARARSLKGRVKVHPRRAPVRETWMPGPTDFPYPLGVPA